MKNAFSVGLYVSDPSYTYFQGVMIDPQPPGYTPTVWSFVMGQDNFKSKGAAKSLIGGHCLLEANQT